MKVLCTLPNASELINGIRFAPTEDGMLSEDVPEDVAERLGTIDGYQIQRDAPRRGRPPKTDEAKAD